MTLLKDNNYKEINVALLSLEADIKKLGNNGGFDTSVIDKQLAEINSRIDKINAGNNNSSAEINDIRTEIENINSKLIGNSVRIENIEQKLSNIFSADNEVTDFNTTTNSGIYYWLGSSANKPGTDYGVLLVNKYDGGDGTSNLWINQIAYGTNNKIYFRQNINNGNWTEWKAVAFEGEVNATTKSVSLSTVTTNTTKYIKLGTFRWYDSFSFRCRIAGNGFEDNVNVNILSSGNSSVSSVCGYYSTNSSLTKSIIVKRGEAWNSDFEIYLKITQLTTADVHVTIDEDVQDRINISESTTAPSGTLEEIVFNNINGMFSGSVEAKNLVLDNVNGISSGYGSAPLTIGFPSGTNDGKSLCFDRNSMQARTNDAVSELYLNYYGGMVAVNAQNNSDGGLKVYNKMVIPIGAPSSLQDGCIWIER